jgi:uncharacterized protein
MERLTKERVAAAYGALMSGDRDKILEFWSEDMRFQMPGNHTYAGWYEGLDDYLGAMNKLMEACGGVMDSTTLDVLLDADDAGGGVSIDGYRIAGQRAHAPSDATSPYERLEIEGVHLLRWVDGRVVEGRGALFGDSATRANLWWSPVGSRGERTVL